MFTLEKLKAREEHKEYIHYIEYKKSRPSRYLCIPPFHHLIST